MLFTCTACVATTRCTRTGIQLVEQPLAHGESWGYTSSSTITSGNSAAAAAADAVPIKKLVLTHPVQGQLGTIYLDLGSRPGKYAHAAHYTIRCGCAVRPADSTTTTAITSASTDADGSAQYQTPVVVLVASLGLPRVAGGARLLSHGELDTLVHEFGHALHSALSRTEFQHTSGTRSAVRLRLHTPV
jgi:Peptidase family M3